MSWLLAAPLRFYRGFISPMFPAVCRYYPSCSRYALEAVQQHGAVKGGWLATRRLCRCHPWAPGGVDQVPDEFHWTSRPVEVSKELS